MPIKGSKILSHPDEVSGTTIFPDGTKCHWTEGRSSTCYFILPDGKKINCNAWGINADTESAALLQKENEIEEMGAEEIRPMTVAEQIDWSVGREYPDVLQQIFERYLEEGKEGYVHLTGFLEFAGIKDPNGDISGYDTEIPGFWTGDEAKSFYGLCGGSWNFTVEEQGHDKFNVVPKKVE